MNSPPKKRRELHLGRTLITGILAALPLLATLWLLSFLLGFVFRWLGPDSIVGRVLGALGVGVSGHGWTGYLMGLVLVILALFVLGLLVERGLAAWMGMLVDRIVGRIPVVRTIYETLEKFVSIFSQRGDSQFASMRPVWCHFGETGQVAALALLSSPEPILVGGRACYALIIPTSPVPIGGGLLFVPVEWVEPANVGIEAVTSIYVSMGVTAPQFLPKAHPDPS